MGAATIAAITGVPRLEYMGSQKVLNREITMSSSYATGGDTLNLATALGLNRITQVVFEGDGGYTLVYDAANGKILAYNGTTQIANTTDLSSVAQRAKIFGK